MGVKGHAQPFEWLLGVDTNPRGDGVYWSCADFAVPVKRSDKDYYDKRWPLFVVQISPIRVYGTPPFNERDKSFVKAIRHLLKEADVKSYDDGLRFTRDGVLSKKQLKSLFEFYLAESGKA